MSITKNPNGVDVIASRNDTVHPAHVTPADQPMAGRALIWSVVLICVAIGGIWVAATIRAQQTPAPSGLLANILQQMQEHRARIQSITYDVATVARYNFGDFAAQQDSLPHSTAFSMHVVQSGDRVRMSAELLSYLSGDRVQRNDERALVNEDVAIHWNRQTNFAQAWDHDSPAEMTKEAVMFVRRMGARDYLTDLYGNGAQYLWEMAESFSGPQFLWSARQEGPRYVIELTSPENPGSAIYEVDPQRGYTVTRSVLLSADGSLRQETVAEARWIEDAGVWVPQRVVGRKWGADAGGEPISTTESTFGNVVVNPHLPEDAFALSSLQLPDNIIVDRTYRDGSSGDNYVVDGAFVSDTSRAQLHDQGILPLRVGGAEGGKQAQ